MPVPDVVPRSPVEARQRLEHFDLPGPEAILVAALLAKPVSKPSFLGIRARALVALPNRPAIMLCQEMLQCLGIGEPPRDSLTCHAWKLTNRSDCWFLPTETGHSSRATGGAYFERGSRQYAARTTNISLENAGQREDHRGNEPITAYMTHLCAVGNPVVRMRKTDAQREDVPHMKPPKDLTPWSEDDDRRAEEALTESEILRMDARMAAASKAKNSLDGYAHDFEKFRRWCAPRNISPLPTNPVVLANFLLDMASQVAHDGTEKYRITTLRRWVTGVDHYHAAELYPEPGRHRLIAKTFAYIERNLKRQTARQRGLSSEEVTAIVDSLDFESWPSAVGAFRDACIFQLGFEGAFRRSELADLNISDLYFEGLRGATVDVRRSKTNQGGDPQKKVLRFRPDARRCVPCAVRNVIALREAYLQSPEGGRQVARSLRRSSVEHICLDGIRRFDIEEPLLPPMPYGRPRWDKRIRGDDVHLAVRRRLEARNYDHKLYGSHSLRIGFITEAAKRGASYKEIMNQSFHKSDLMVDKYVRLDDPYEMNAVNNLYPEDSVFPATRLGNDDVGDDDGDEEFVLR